MALANLSGFSVLGAKMAIIMLVKVYFKKYSVVLIPATVPTL
jgi:hypothetical protein